MSQVHPVARTTPRTRAEMRSSEDSSAELAKRYNVSIATARKWKGRDDSQDRSHRPTSSPRHWALARNCSEAAHAAVGSCPSAWCKSVSPEGLECAVLSAAQQAGEWVQYR